jgi:hypothetical protein
MVMGAARLGLVVLDRLRHLEEQHLVVLRRCLVALWIVSFVCIHGAHSIHKQIKLVRK